MRYLPLSILDVIDEQSPFYLAQVTCGSYSLCNMDIEFDGDLDEIEKVEIIGYAGGTFKSH